MKFVLFKKSLDEGASPVYLFDGEEEYFKQRGEEMLKERYLGEPSLNYTVFQGSALKGGALSDLIAAARCVPFLSEKRIVKVVDLYPSEREYETYLRPYFQSPELSTILLIVNGGKGKGFDLRKAAGVTRVDCSKADEEIVLRWIYTRFKRAGVHADTDTCARIFTYCLGDMSRVAGETEKLIAYAGEGGTVGVADVDAVVYQDTDYKIYEMTDALGGGNAGKYLSVLHELSEKGMDEGGVLNALLSYFRTLADVTLSRGTDAETASALGMKEFAVKMNRRRAAAFGKDRVLAAYRFIFGKLNAVRSGASTAQGALLAVNAYLLFGERKNQNNASEYLPYGIF